jgi:hypothetical protein
MGQNTTKPLLQGRVQKYGLFQVRSTIARVRPALL